MLGLLRRRIRPTPATGSIEVMGTLAYQEVYGLHGRSVIERVNQMLTHLSNLWSPSNPSNIMARVRETAGAQGVRADRETLRVIRVAKDISLISEGAYDITVDPLIRLWRKAIREKLPPPTERVRETLSLVDHSDLRISPDGEILLARAGQGIDLGGIGKGYAADLADVLYEENGIRRAILNIGGHVMAKGERPGGGAWRIGVKDPRSSGSRPIGYIEAVDCSVVTSGDYELFFEIRDSGGRLKRLHHIIDPRTGWPVDNGIASVTVVSSSSIHADSLATAATVLGVSGGMDLCRGFGGTHMLMVEENGRLHMSSGMISLFTRLALPN